MIDPDQLVAQWLAAAAHPGHGGKFHERDWPILRERQSEVLAALYRATVSFWFQRDRATGRLVVSLRPARPAVRNRPY